MPPLPVDAAQALLTSLGNEVRGYFKVQDNPVFDTAGFLASTTQPPVAQQPAKALGRFVCRQWARQTDASTNPAADRLYTRACGPYLDSIGEGVDAGEVGSGFTGGQCPGVSYSIAWQINQTACSNGARVQLAAGTTIALGPISRAKSKVSFNATTDTWTFRILGQGSNNSVNQSNLGKSCATSPFSGTNPDWGSFIVTRVDGQPDNCGSPPVIYERPRPPIVLPPIPPIFIDIPDFGPINVEVNLDNSGTINIGSPTLNVSVTVNPPDADGGATGGPTLPPVAGDEEVGGDGSNDFGAPPGGRRWVGCCISLSTLPVGTGIVPGTAPATVLTQVVGNARLLFDSVSGDSYDTPVQIRSAGLCLWEPVKGLSPTGVRVNLKPGFAFTYIPYSVPEDN